jgi:hypothetical protein
MKEEKSTKSKAKKAAPEPSPKPAAKKLKPGKEEGKRKKKTSREHGKGLPGKQEEGPARKASAVAAARLPSAIDPGERHRLIREAAYYRAERRGFEGGDPTDDWAAAEAEIDRMLSPK